MARSRVVTAPELRPSKVFSFKSGYRFKNQHQANPQTVGEALEVIRMANGGELEKENVVAAVRLNPRHVLRPFFTESVEEAAHLRWLDEAGDLIGALLVLEPGHEDEEPRIAYYSAPSQKGDSERRVYHPRTAVETSRKLQLLVYADAERALEAWERRYAELADLCRQVAAIRASLNARRRQLLDDAPQLGYPPFN